MSTEKKQKNSPLEFFVWLHKDGDLAAFINWIASIRDQFKKIECIMVNFTSKPKGILLADGEITKENIGSDNKYLDLKFYCMPGTDKTAQEMLKGKITEDLKNMGIYLRAEWQLSGIGIRGHYITCYYFTGDDSIERRVWVYPNGSMDYTEPKGTESTVTKLFKGLLIVFLIFMILEFVYIVL